jgi:hypothetical protein
MAEPRTSNPALPTKWAINLGVPVVGLDGELEPDPWTGQVVLIRQADGSLDVADPSPLAKLPAAKRQRVVLGVVECRALRGDMDAAKLLLSWWRWNREMKRGRAPVRGTVQHDHRVTVVDDLGRSEPVDITASYRTLDTEQSSPAKA